MQKLIKVTSRGTVLTSRGKCRTPFLSPVWENIDIIFQMISAQRATVVEVLENGDEVTLTPFNYDKDNSNGGAATAMSKPEPPVVGKINTKKNKPAKTTKPEPEVVKEEVKEEPVTPVEEVKATVEEVLAEPATEEVKEEVVEEVKEEVKEETPAPVANTKNMSRKERKRLEYLAKKESEENQTSEVTEVENSEVPADAIEE